MRYLCPLVVQSAAWQPPHFVHAFQQSAPHEEQCCVSGGSAGPMQPPNGHVHDFDRVRVPEPQEAGHPDQAPQLLQHDPQPGSHAWCEECLPAWHEESLFTRDFVPTPQDPLQVPHVL